MKNILKITYKDPRYADALVPFINANAPIGPIRLDDAVYQNLCRLQTLEIVLAPDADEPAPVLPTKVASEPVEDTPVAEVHDSDADSEAVAGLDEFAEWIEKIKVATSIEELREIASSFEVVVEGDELEGVRTQLLLAFEGE